MKKPWIVGALWLALCVAGIVFMVGYYEGEQARLDGWIAGRNILSRLEPYLEEGRRIDFSQVYPEKWDTMKMYYGLYESDGYDHSVTLAFDSEFSLYGDYPFLIGLYDEGQMVGYEANSYPYGPLWLPIPLADKAGNRYYRHLELPREAAVFTCVEEKEPGKSRYYLLLEGYTYGENLSTAFLGDVEAHRKE